MIKRKLLYTKPAAILLGFVAFVTQVILLREFLTFFNGNELVIGIILANWMLLTGFGAFLGRFPANAKNIQRWILSLLGLFAFLPFITVVLLHLIWHHFFPPGIMPGILHVFYYSLFILSPFCILSGSLFTLLARDTSWLRMKNKIGDVYAWESVGSVIGGLILNFILIWILTTFQGLFVIMLFIAGVVIILSIKTKHLLTAGSLFFMLLLFSFLFLSNNLDVKIRGLAFPGQQITDINDSPYGIFITTEQSGQTNYYENNVLMASSGDAISREELAHLAMVQHPEPKNVLVLSGIISGIMHEIMKYPVQQVDYVDVNPEIIRMAEQNIGQQYGQKLNLIQEDAQRFLKKNNQKYDVVLINLPKPSTIQLNRYYTREFFQRLKLNLQPGAVICLPVAASGNYMNDETRRFLSIIYQTLGSEFKNVLLLSSGANFLLASDSTLTYDISKRIQKQNIETEYVNSYYFDDELVKMRSENIISQLDKNVPLNLDFSPVFYQSQIKLWLSHFNIRYWIPAICILIFAGFFFFRTNLIFKGVFAAGFAGTSIEIVMLLVFQVIFGYVYAMAGIFIMIFMAGLAFGAYYPIRYIKEVSFKVFRKVQLGIALFAFLLPLLFVMIKNMDIHDYILFALFAILLLIISVLSGLLFTIASHITNKSYGQVASGAYGLDLLGAATGALLFTIYLIPMLGFGWSVAIAGLLNLSIAFLTPSESFRKK